MKVALITGGSRGLIADLEQMRYSEAETDFASTAPARATR